MKIWNSYGSEHSMNLVLIGHFKEVADASRAKELIEEIRKKVEGEVAADTMEIGEGTGRFPDAISEFLREKKIYDLSRSELEQFAYDFDVRHSGSDLVLTTDESEVSAFLKIMVDRKARVEIYSAHHYKGTE